MCDRLDRQAALPLPGIASTAASAESQLRDIAARVLDAITKVHASAAETRSAVERLPVPDAAALIAEIDAAESRKVAALETDAVAIDATLEALQSAREAVSPLHSGAAAATLSAAVKGVATFFDAPREPTDILLVQTESAEGASFRICAPPALTSADVEVRLAPLFQLALTESYVLACGSDMYVRRALDMIVAQAKLNFTPRPTDSVAGGTCDPVLELDMMLPRVADACVDIVLRLPSGSIMSSPNTYTLASVSLRGEILTSTGISLSLFPSRLSHPRKSAKGLAGRCRGEAVCLFLRFRF